MGNFDYSSIGPARRRVSATISATFPPLSSQIRPVGTFSRMGGECKEAGDFLLRGEDVGGEPGGVQLRGIERPVNHAVAVEQRTENIRALFPLISTA